MSLDEYVADLVRLSEDDYALYMARNLPLDPHVATIQLDGSTSTPPYQRLPVEDIDTSIRAWSTAVSSATAAETEGSFLTTPVSTMGSEGASLETGTSLKKKTRRKNEKPCGACQQIKRGCVIVRTEPSKLCQYCESKGKPECPDHVPGEIVRGVYGTDGASKRGSSNVAHNDGFVYENVA